MILILISVVSITTFLVGYFTGIGWAVNEMKGDDEN